MVPLFEVTRILTIIALLFATPASATFMAEYRMATEASRRGGEHGDSVLGGIVLVVLISWYILYQVEKNWKMLTRLRRYWLSRIGGTTNHKQ